MPRDTSIHWSSATALTAQLPDTALPPPPFVLPSIWILLSFLVARRVPLLGNARGAKVLSKVLASVEHPTATSDSHSKNCACVSPTVTGGSPASLVLEEVPPPAKLARREQLSGWLHDTFADPRRPWLSPVVVARPISESYVVWMRACVVRRSEQLCRSASAVSRVCFDRTSIDRRFRHISGWPVVSKICHHPVSARVMHLEVHRAFGSVLSPAAHRPSSGFKLGVRLCPITKKHNENVWIPSTRMLENILKSKATI